LKVRVRARDFEGRWPGKAEASWRNGEWLEIPREAWMRISAQGRAAGGPWAWGDWVEARLKPWVRGTRWEVCSGCRRRRGILNRLSEGLWRVYRAAKRGLNGR
jgi:hypothetical protein